jgi:hypothetical protein
MEIKIIKKIKFHTEFNKTYMNDLHVCKPYLSAEEIKKNKYCSEHCKNNCYSKQKQYFEQYVCVVRNPEMMYLERVSEDNSITYTKKCGMAGRYESCFQFVTKWMRDVNIKSYSRLGFYPDTTKCPENVFNMFSGYAIHKIYQKLPKSERKELIEPILKHLHDVFENDKIVNYNIKHFAHVLQKPGTKLGVSLVYQGEQGTGKSWLIEKLLESLLGKKLCYYTCKPSDIAGDHSEGQVNKLVVVLDEATGKTSFDISELLKSLITQTTLTVNPKGIRPFEVLNFAVYFFMSNNDTPLKIPVGDRRYLVCRMLNTYKCNVDYYAAFSEYMARPDVLSAWYDYLMDVDIENFDFINGRPFS